MYVGPVRFEQTSLDSVSSPNPAREAKQQLVQAVRTVNATGIVGQDRVMTIVIDQDTRRPVIRIVDEGTQEVVRQIPAEYVLQLARNLRSAP
ncbi:MAG: flagellar protein FlaG [Acidobacteria bacterium]|nr:flagellar protein FlaG [Acidobacteriota bacterium]